MSRNYAFKNPNGLYFISFATVHWVAVFIRDIYFQLLVESLTYCRETKGMELFAYCIMPNHVHLIFKSSTGNPSGLIRDLKKYTSKKLIQTIRTNFKESRRERLLDMFQKAGQSKSNIAKYQFWQHHNHPIELWSTAVIRQKLKYIHNNPVKSGFVESPEDWKYSSAANFSGKPAVLEIDEIGFLG